MPPGEGALPSKPCSSKGCDYSKLSSQASFGRAVVNALPLLDSATCAMQLFQWRLLRRLKAPG